MVQAETSSRRLWSNTFMFSKVRYASPALTGRCISSMQSRLSHTPEGASALPAAWLYRADALSRYTVPLARAWLGIALLMQRGGSPNSRSYHS